MRDEEQQRIALECLKLAVAHDACNAVAEAEAFYAFVTGETADDSKAKLAAVRKALT